VGQVGGFRRSGAPSTSWASRVALAAPGEEWPRTEGQPMLALLQLVVPELPVVPDALRDSSLVTLFVGPFELPVDEANGSRWCLRSYPALDELEPLVEPPSAREANPKLAKAEATSYRAFPVRWHEITDWPTLDDVPLDLRDDWEAAGAGEAFPNTYGLKVGGWPSTVQSELFWSEWGERLDEVDFVLQVASDEKTGFVVGYGGVLYIGRSRGRGSWHCCWQSL
jgi:hypothetical protein